MFLLGQKLNPYKRVIYAIQRYKGIGPKVSAEICQKASIHPFCLTQDLNETHIEKIKPLVFEITEKMRSEAMSNIKKQRLMIEPIQPKPRKK
jgi:ribosomal protein S13